MVEVQSCEVVALPAPLGLFSIVGFAWLYHIQSLADVTKARTLPKVVKLNYSKLN
jgi:hypothetical protein